MKKNASAKRPATPTSGLDRLEIYSLAARGVLIVVALFLAYSFIGSALGATAAF